MSSLLQLGRANARNLLNDHRHVSRTTAITANKSIDRLFVLSAFLTRSVVAILYMVCSYVGTDVTMVRKLVHVDWSQAMMVNEQALDMRGATSRSVRYVNCRSSKQ